MAVRRIFLQLGILAGFLAFGVTFWMAWSRNGIEIVQALMRAIGAGIAILMLALILAGIAEKLGGPTSDEAEIEAEADSPAESAEQDHESRRQLNGTN